MGFSLDQYLNEKKQRQPGQLSTETTTTPTGSRASGGSGFSLDGYIQERGIRTGQLQKQDKDFNAWLGDMGSFSSRMSSDYNRRKTTYQSPDAFRAYQEKTGTEIADLLQRAKAAKRYYAQYGKVYDETRGKGSTAKLLEGIDQNIGYLEGMQKGLQSEGEWWGQFLDQSDFDAYQQTREYSAMGAAARELGRFGAGNIDLYNRPQLQNEDGTISTVRSITITEDGKEIVIPTVRMVRRQDERKPIQMTDQQAINYYHLTGKYLGKFDTKEEAEAYAQKLHQAQEFYYGSRPNQELMTRGEPKLNYLATIATSLGDEMAPPVYEDSGWKDPFYAWVNGSTEAGTYLQTQDNIYGAHAGTLGHIMDTMVGGNQEAAEMTPEEIATYNYIYANESPEEAIKFYEYIKSDLYRRQREAEEEMWAKRADKDPAGTSVFSILMSPMKGVSYAMQLGDYLGIDQNAPYNSFSYVPAAIRSEVAKNTEKYWVDRGHKFVGKSASFLYQTGMSMGDFVFNTAVSGGNSKVALAIMGTGAAADATIAAKDRGLSDDQAFALGTIAGIAEVVTEKFSLDALLKGKWEEGAIRYLIKNAFTEGAEEVGSDAINLFADILISKDQSKWAQAITAYEDEGKSESEAFWRAVQDQALSMGLDFLGGALSGGVLSGVNVAIDSHYDRAVGRDFRQGLKSMDGVYQAVIDTGLESDADSNAYRLAKRYQQQLDKKGALTDGQLGRLYRANIAAIEAEGMKAGTAIRADTSVFDGRILQDLNKARAAFIEFAKKHFPSTVKNIETGREIGISRKGLDKFLSGRIAYEKYASGFHIPELVERAHKVAYAKNEHVEQAESIPTYDYYDSPIEIDGINYMAHIRVRNTMMGDKYYGHTISEIEDIKIEPSARTSVPGKTPAGQPVNAIDGSINSIPQTTQDVNLRRSLPGDIPADIPPGLRKLYRLAQEMSASPPPREIPQRPVQQSPQDILTQLAREMAQDSLQGGALADLSDEDMVDILQSIHQRQSGDAPLKEVDMTALAPLKEYDAKVQVIGKFSPTEYAVKVTPPIISGTTQHFEENLKRKSDRAGLTVTAAQAIMDNNKLVLWQPQTQTLKILSDQGYIVVNLEGKLVTAVPEKLRKKYKDFLEGK